MHTQMIGTLNIIGEDSYLRVTSHHCFTGSALARFAGAMSSLLPRQAAAAAIRFIINMMDCDSHALYVCHSYAHI